MDFIEDKDSDKLERIYLNLNEEIDFNDFKGLKKLSITGYSMKIVPDIEYLKDLECLWLIDCNIKDADQVANCYQLKELYLYNNTMTKIPSVGQLRQLRVLWLSGNKIKSIEDTEIPSSLKELNLADNEIRTISYAFPENCSLEKLNLAGNPLQTIFEINNLKNLKSLRSLVLYDPMYRVTEIINLRLYRSFVVNALPQLKQLDGFEVEELEVELTKIFYENKNLYYRMMKNNIFYEYYNEIKQSCHKASRLLCEIKNKLYTFSCQENKICVKNSSDDYDKLKVSLNMKLDELSKKNHIQQMDTKRLLNVKLSHLKIEQKYFGNIKFEELSTNPEVADIFQEILSSFLCPYMKKAHNIKGINIKLITLVINSEYPLHEEFQSIMAILTQEKSARIYILSEPHFIQSKYEEFYDFGCGTDISSERFETTQTVTQCFLLAETLGKELRNNRVASLAIFLENETFIMQTAKHGETNLNFKCEVRRIVHREELKPYFLIDYRYIFQEEDNCDWVNQTQFIESGEHQMNPYRSFDYKFWNTLRKISFTHQSLNRFGVPGQWPNIQELDVSYNKFNSLTEIFHLFPHLEVLNASFNKIANITNSLMRHLKELDLSWNSISMLLPVLKCLKHSPEIRCLSLQHNSFTDLYESSHENIMVLNYLKNLVEYNGINTLEVTNSNVKPLFIISMNSEVEVLYESEDSSIYDREVIANKNYFEKNCFILNTKEVIKFVSLIDGIQCLNVKFDFNTKSLTSLKISQNKLMKTNFLNEMPNLVNLDLSFNMLTSMDGVLLGLTKLVTINLSGNYIDLLEESGILQLPLLKVLDISRNCLKSLFDIQYLTNLEELYVGYNNIQKVDNYIFLKAFKNLKIIDVRENNILDMEIVRNYLVFHIPNLQYVNGTTVTEDEIFEANNDFGGVLDYEYLETLNKFEDIRSINHLSLMNSSIKRVSLKEVLFKNLNSVNLENNGLETLIELTSIGTLKILNLTGNHVNRFGDVTSINETFIQLEEIHLNSNYIKDLELLQFFRMPLLKKLFLQDNEITAIKGIEGLSNLQILVLDNNKIYSVESKYISKLSNIRELHLQSNYIDSLEFLQEVNKIEHFHAANNRIKDVKALSFLKYTTRLESISLSGNPLFKNVDGYVHLLSNLPEVSCVDGVSIEMYRDEDEEIISNE